MFSGADPVSVSHLFDKKGKLTTAPIRFVSTSAPCAAMKTIKARDVAKYLQSNIYFILSFRKGEKWFKKLRAFIS